jgi:esterase/lipase superfamily enzyme
MRFPQFIAATWLVLVCALAPASAEKHVALVVGNDRYVNLPANEQLQKAVNDARAVGGALRQTGFDVIAGENLVRSALVDKLNEMTERLGPGDTAFFFFSGHGVALDGINYILPADVPDVAPGQETLLKNEALAEPYIIAGLTSRGVKVAVMVLDASHTNPFARPGRDSVGNAKGLLPPPRVQGVLSLHAAGDGEAALDQLSGSDPNPNSVFTRVLAPALTKPGIDLRALAVEVSAEVTRIAQAAGYDQRPAHDDQTAGGPLHPAEVRLLREDRPAAAVRPVTAARPPSQPHTSPRAAEDPNLVEFLFATTRKQTSVEPVRFSGERSEHDEIVYGAARVHVPEGHRAGQIELPGYTWWSLFTFESKPDEKKHFIIRSVAQLSEKNWKHYIGQQGKNEALVFVHGFDTSFEDALYRNAQIVFDLPYTHGISVLFTWASGGRVGITDYEYDTNSARLAAASFRQVLRTLRSAGIERIHVLAHSMGNQVVLDALAQEAGTAAPLGIAQLIMAAPDVDNDLFTQWARLVRRITKGMTLYASSADRAMEVSRTLARRPRAGDVTTAGPVIVDGIDTIDVTPLGEELFGLNHDTFATSRSVLDDVGRIVLSGLRPPNARSPDNIRPMPEGISPPKFWRYRE